MVLISEEKLQRINAALDAGIEALAHVARTGSLSKEQREKALLKLWEARQDQLFDYLDGSPD